jgi:hypothetical protein
MTIKQDAKVKSLNSLGVQVLFLLFSFVCINPMSALQGDEGLVRTSDYSNAEDLCLNDLEEKKCKKKKLTYYLYIEDFINSFIEIPTSNVSGDSTTVSSKYLAGRAPIYNECNKKFGICSASFLCMQNADGIFTDIANYLSIDNGLIVTWFSPSTLINLELDSIVHSMVTECIVVASTKIGFNPYYGKTFNLVVSSDDDKIYFEFSKQ